MPKPVIVIVPGAWHRPKHYQKLINALADVGYEAVGVTLPSVDSSPPLPSWDQDAAETRRVIMEYLDAGKDVILIGHSFGGVAMSEAVKGLGKEDREKTGLKGSVIRLVYMCAMAMPKGQTFMGQMVPATPEEEEIERQRKSFEAQQGKMKTTEVRYADLIPVP
jgi:alpha-beta hydrolase superfamily lysophospholipase